MFEILTLNYQNDYFLTLSKREKRGVYFCRFIGFDNEKLSFYHQYQLACQQKGIYLKQTIDNPTDKEVKAFFHAVGTTEFSLEEKFVQLAADRFLTAIAPQQRRLFIDSLHFVMQERQRDGMNLNILKNSFVKYMCWAKSVFSSVISHLGEEIPPKILYEGEIGKHELLMLRILNFSGCDIVYLNFITENSYLKIDIQGKWSQKISGQQKGTPPTHFIQLSSCEKPALKPKKNPCATTELIETNSWFEGSFQQQIFKTNAQRGILNNTKVYNMYIRYLGIDEKNEYSNRIYKIYKTLQESKKSFVLVENIPNPSMDETNRYRIDSYKNKEDIVQKLSLKILSTNHADLDSMLKNAFQLALEQTKEASLSKIFNLAMKLVCWLNRYLKGLFEHYQKDLIPVFLYYGQIHASEIEFLMMLSNMPVDVIYICPDKAFGSLFLQYGSYNKSKEELLPNNSEIFPFPQKETRVRIVTPAYDAERELDTMLYQGTGLFRHRQFTRSKPITLKTTYDEVEILWKVEAKFRPGFEQENNTVIVPNLFAKICGVPNGDSQAYFKKISTFLTDKTIYIKKLPYITNETPNPIRPYAYQFIKNGELLPDVIKKHRLYPYDYLNEDTQDYILEKIQEMIELKWIHANTGGIEYAIVATILNLERNIVRLLQQFDFTKEIPKVVIIDVDESLSSLEDCITILFLNLVGFDIVVFTPTGFRNIDKYISKEAFEEHQAGEYLFNLIVPPLDKLKLNNPSSVPEGGIFNRLFGRGRN